MTQKTNPFRDKPCNYKSFGDYCNPEMCWCSKASKWDIDNPQLPTETIEVDGCGDCPFKTTLPLMTDWCSHPNHENKGYVIFDTCPLKKSSITIKIKQNEPTGN